MKTTEDILELIEPVTESGCWIWHGPTSEKGYAKTYYRKRDWRVHRLMYELFIGQIPNAVVCDHRCRVRCCVNPYHIDLVSDEENILRGFGFAARNKRKTHCKYGHTLADENIYVPPGRPSRRLCVECKKRWSLKS
jgi:HNH endonuclease